MPRSFRFEPPEPRPGSLTRPRLLRALLGRWEHRVTVVVGGPGLGKTTLLAQAASENRLAPRGQDVWIGLAPGDADGDALARDVLAAVTALASGDAPAPPTGTRDDAPSPAVVADAVWRQSPTALCLVIDDVHWLPPGSPGARWLTALVDALPANGHVLVAGRWAPAIPLARLSSQGAVLRLDEDDLRFSEDEITGFAARRGLDVGRFGEIGGWPAMAELAASVDGDLTGAFLWEEVLDPLGPERRRVLAVLSDLGGADDDLAGAVLGGPVELGQVLDGVPLVAEGADGWRVPHQLWRTVPALALAAEDRLAVRRAAVDHLVACDRYDEAFALAGDAGLDDVLPVILRAASIGPLRPPAGRLDRWLAAVPPDVRDTPGVVLAAGLRAAVGAPVDAVDPLRAAITRCREAGDTDGELGAIAPARPGRVVAGRRGPAGRAVPAGPRAGGRRTPRRPRHRRRRPGPDRRPRRRRRPGPGPPGRHRARCPRRRMGGHGGLAASDGRARSGRCRPGHRGARRGGPRVRSCVPAHGRGHPDHRPLGARPRRRDDGRARSPDGADPCRGRDAERDRRSHAGGIRPGRRG